jgi:HK97 family phage prohead protease
MNSEIERRSTTQAAAIETREDGSAKLTGYAAVWDSETMIGGMFREVVRKGAFAKSIADGADVRALWNHNDDVVLGRTKSGTLKLEEDETGLRYEVELPDTQAARDAITTIKRGDVSGSSFGFLVPKGGAVWSVDSNGSELRELLQVQLLDVSPVAYPAYDDTTVAARSLERFREESVAMIAARNANKLKRVELEEMEL